MVGEVSLCVANVDDGRLVRITADRDVYSAPSFLRGAVVTLRPDR